MTAHFSFSILAVVLATPALAQSAPASPSAPLPLSVQLQRTGQAMAGGYLAASEVPDSSVIVPPPPAPGSAAQARDEEGAANALTQQGGARWGLAAADADLSSPDFISAFSCAAGLRLGASATPAIAKLLRGSTANLGLSTSAAKRQYMRPRPFTVNGKPTCTPDWEPLLRRDGSYPSGHSAIGYGLGLILAEVLPDRATALVARGRAFGDSRRICNVHWLSDIEEGRIMASATVARLNASPAFQADLAAARVEVAAAVKTDMGKDCAAEAATLAATH